MVDRVFKVWQQKPLKLSPNFKAVCDLTREVDAMSVEFSDVYDTEDEETVETPESGPKALREALKREAERRKELEAELLRRDDEARQSKLVEALNSAGLNPVVADLIPKDTDPGEWITKYGPAFGAQAQEEVAPEPVPDEVTQLAAVSGAPGGQPASGTPATPDDVQAFLNQPFKSKEELMAALREQAQFYK